MSWPGQQQGPCLAINPNANPPLGIVLAFYTKPIASTQNEHIRIYQEFALISFLRVDRLRRIDRVLSSF